MNNEQSTQSNTHTKVTIGLVLSWVFGVMTAITGIGIIFSQFLAGILMLLLAAILLPPVNKSISNKLNFSISGGLKIVVVIILLGVIGAVMPTDSTPTPTLNSTTNTAPKTEQVEENTEEEAPSVPREYKSALSKASFYADTMNMSKLAIYEQLVSEFGEKFSEEAAQYAMDNVEADWNENALVKAEFYQSTLEMSPSAIREQLVSGFGEKFTEAEADYAMQNLSN
jgi:hypothetical protein